MTLWSTNVAVSTSAPTHSNDKLKANSFNSNALYNSTVGGYPYPKMVFGEYGISNAQANAAGFSANAAHKKNNIVPGWAVVRQWMGPLGNLSISFAGNTYVNGMFATFTSTVNGTINASAVISTNAAGAITGLALQNTNSQNNAGLFVNSSSVTVGFTNSTGGSTGVPTAANVANVNFSLFGRANRMHVETLVVLPSASANSSYNTVIFPLS